MVIICVVIAALVWLLTVHPVALPVAIACLVLILPGGARQPGDSSGSGTCAPAPQHDLAARTRGPGSCGGQGASLPSRPATSALLIANGAPMLTRLADQWPQRATNGAGWTADGQYAGAWNRGASYLTVQFEQENVPPSR